MEFFNTLPVLLDCDELETGVLTELEPAFGVNCLSVLLDSDELEVGNLAELGLLDFTSRKTVSDAPCFVRVVVPSTHEVLKTESFTKLAPSLLVFGTADFTESDPFELLEVLPSVIVLRSVCVLDIAVLFSLDPDFLHIALIPSALVNSDATRCLWCNLVVLCVAYSFLFCNGFLLVPDCDELEIGVLTKLGPLLLDSTGGLTPFDASCTVRVTVLTTLTVFKAEAFTGPALSLPVSGILKISRIPISLKFLKYCLASSSLAVKAEDKLRIR